MIRQSLSPSTNKIHASLLLLMRKMKWHWCDGMWAKRVKVRGVQVCTDHWGRARLCQLLGRGGVRGVRNMSPKLDMFRRVRFGVRLPEHGNLRWAALGWLTHYKCVAEITLGPRLDTTTTIEAGISCSMVALTTITTTWSWIKNQLD